APLSSTRPVTHLTFMQVKDLWTGGLWDRDKMEDILGEGGGFSSLEIDQIRQILILEGGLDGMRWRLTSLGAFSTSSAWGDVRLGNRTNLLFGAIWIDLLTPTISVFLWRLILRRIPIDTVMQARGFSFPFRCHCCVETGTFEIETFTDLFLESEIVRRVWEHYARYTHIPLPTTDNFFELLSFFSHRTDNRHVGFLIPCLIIWGTWTERNNAKHRDIIFSCAHIILQVDRHLSLLTAQGRLTTRDWTGCTPPHRWRPPPSFPIQHPRPRTVASRALLLLHARALARAPFAPPLPTRESPHVASPNPTPSRTPGIGLPRARLSRLSTALGPIGASSPIARLLHTPPATVLFASCSRAPCVAPSTPTLIRSRSSPASPHASRTVLNARLRPICCASPQAPTYQPFAHSCASRTDAHLLYFSPLLLLDLPILTLTSVSFPSSSRLSLSPRIMKFSFRTRPSSSFSSGNSPGSSFINLTLLLDLPNSI
ncbi:Unknown protein, partial [Striga hermonthica]